MSSIYKFNGSNPDDEYSNRGRYYWGRAEVDGLPVRSKTSPPLLTEDEHERSYVTVNDAHNGTYHTWIPKENAKYLRILDEAANGWSTIWWINRWPEDVEIDGRVQKGMAVYVEWVRHCKEYRGRGVNGMTQEFGHGQAKGPFNS